MYCAVVCTVSHQRVQKVMTSIGSKRELIENSFDICAMKVEIRHLCISIYSWLFNPIDVTTLLMR